MSNLRMYMPLTDLDRFIETLGLMALVLIVSLPLYFYGSLPSRIPLTFGEDGMILLFVHRWIVWLVSVLGLALYCGLAFLSRRPYYIDYPLPIDKQNAKAQYTLSARFIRVYNVLFICFFSFLCLELMRAAHYRSLGIQQEWLALAYIFSAFYFCLYIYCAKKMG